MNGKPPARPRPAAHVQRAPGHMLVAESLFQRVHFNGGNPVTSELVLTYHYRTCVQLARATTRSSGPVQAAAKLQLPPTRILLPTRSLVRGFGSSTPSKEDDYPSAPEGGESTTPSPL